MHFISSRPFFPAWISSTDVSGYVRFWILFRQLRATMLFLFPHWTLYRRMRAVRFWVVHVGVSISLWYCSPSGSCSPWSVLCRLKDYVVGAVWIGTDVQRRRILDPRSANRGYLRAIVLLAWSAASRFQVPLDLFCGLSPPQGDGRRSLLVILAAISLLALFSWEPQPVSTW